MDPRSQTYDAITPEASKPGALVAITLTILHHPNPDRIGDRLTLAELGEGRKARLSRDAPLFAPPSGSSARPLKDACVSRSPFVIAPARGGGVRIERRESRTALVYRAQAIKSVLELSSADVDRGVVLMLGGRIVLLLHRMEAVAMPEGEAMGLVGESAAMLRVRREIRTLAELESPVLLRGETGTGKDLAARAIHQASARRDGPFVAVNLAAIPPSLASAELFGAEKGSFTGADKERPGYFHVAQGGTLFLDEIGDAPPDVQVMLLRAIETGEAQALGAGRARKSDVRILAATDADLESKVRDGSFRAPLLYRLSSYVIRMPPLRERRDDIGRLLIGFLREELSKTGELHRLSTSLPDGKTWLSASIVARLAELDWIGNVRQLRNVARQLVISSRGRDRVELSPAIEQLFEEARSQEFPSIPHSIPHPSPHPRESDSSIEPPVTSRRKPAEITEAELSAALRACRWDLAATANALGIPRASVYVLIERSGRLKTAADLSAEEIKRCYDECGGDLGRMVERLEVSEKALRRRIRELGLPASSKPSGR